MGAINYFTSDYITLGIKPYDTEDYTRDAEFMQFIRDEWNIDTDDENAVYNAVQNQIAEDYSCDRLNVETELAKHGFYYFHVTIKPGYYEGFTLDIENNFPVAFDWWQEKRDAQKEITKLKQFLVACAGMGLVACAPGWCTGYSDYKQTLQKINEAVKEMREEVKTTPTWLQYNRACGVEV